MHLSARQVPDQPSFHRAKQELPFISQLPHSWNVIKNPLNFCCREVGVDNQARFLPHVRLQALIFELCAIIRSAAALPNDRVISWLSGGFIPEDRRLALVGDANCSDLPGIHLPGGEHRRHRLKLAVENLHWIVLHPPGIGVELLKFPLRLRKDVPALVEYDRPRACGALIQRHYILTQTDGLPLFPVYYFACCAPPSTEKKNRKHTPLNGSSFYSHIS
jgi:hypothetical protein